MARLEINIVVPDCGEAVRIYTQVFEAEKRSLTRFPKGVNEAKLTVGGIDLHLFDENEEYDFYAPGANDNAYMWWHLTVDDVDGVFKRAAEAGFEVASPLRNVEDYDVRQAIVVDPFGFSWILTQHLEEF